MRRRLLQGVGAGLLAPWPCRAQAPARASDAPRHALVVGNARYADPLRNPVNDARAMSEVLRSAGFEVTTGIDLDRKAMLEAVRAFAGRLAARRPVGLFYFAGHGVQLAWRNYLLPIDAEVASVAEVQERCIDVHEVLEGMARAANPMNIVVLDACRDNPFGRDFRVEHKGLSQLDAPPGTLLAYATAPGHTASDGEGAHGLYTGHLVQEIAVPALKIEDVFKRVRLAVRRRSHGLQVPWESTSLEEDFWFIAPAAPRQEDRYAEELALWERARQAREPGPLEEYLRRFPSGRFSELALLALDRVLAALGENKIGVSSSPENPYSKGWAAADTRYAVGDRYRFRVLGLESGRLEREFMLRITEVTATEVLYNNGALVTDLLGNPLKFGDGRRLSPNQNYPAEFAVGRTWTSRFTVTNPAGRDVESEIDFRIVGRERVRVPAGEFDAFRVEGRGRARAPWMPMPIEVSLKSWFAPERCRLPVAREELRRAPRRVLAAERTELVAFSQA